MLPPAPAAATAPPIPQDEAAATLAALRPPKGPRPVIAIVGANEGTETTDYLMPYGILRRAGIAEVLALATKPGPVTLYPVFRVEPDATIADFDARHPQGADYVIVPAMGNPDDPVVLHWIRAQAQKGAIVIGVCAGAPIVANAGLLDGRRATTHWFYRDDMLDAHPAIRYVPDRRLVVDGRVVTTVGITASMPMMLTLIEAIAGREKAAAVAFELGVARWDARHASAAFEFTRPFAWTAMTNKLAFWSHEKLGLMLEPGADEVALALMADAWSRTYRSQAVTLAAGAGAVRTHSGLRILPDETAASWPAQRRIAPVANRKAAAALDETLRDIETRYGARTARMVAMQLEYPWPGVASR